MHKRSFLTVGAVLFLATACFTQAANPPQKKAHQDARENTILARLPAPVKQTVQAQAASATLNSAQKVVADGEITYDITITRDGKARDFTVDTNGALIDMQMFLPELPAVVQKSIQARTKGTVGDIYRSIDDGKIKFDVDVTAGGKTHTHTFADDGRLLTEEVELDSLPAAVQQTIQKQSSGATLGEIDESFEDTEVTFDVEMTRDGQARSFTVNAKGELVDVQMFLSELSDPLQKAIQKEAGPGTLGEIDRAIDDGEPTFDVDITAGATTRTVTFTEDGSIVLQEQPVKFTDIPEPAQKAIQALGGKLLSLSKVSEDGDISYDVDYYVSNAQKSVSIGPDGKTLPDDD